MFNSLDLVKCVSAMLAAQLKDDVIHKLVDHYGLDH